MTKSSPFRATQSQHEVHCCSTTVGGWLDHYDQARHGTNLTQVMYRLSLYYPGLPERLRAVPCVWSGRLGTSAGYASSIRGITMHPALQREGAPEIIATLLHEVAHMAQHLLHGVIDHGPTWHEMMWLLGETPTRTHRMKLDSVTIATAEDLGL